MKENTLHDLHGRPDIIRTSKSCRLIGLEHMGSMEEEKTLFCILKGSRRLMGRHRCQWVALLDCNIIRISNS